MYYISFISTYIYIYICMTAKQFLKSFAPECAEIVVVDDVELREPPTSNYEHHLLP